MYGSEDARTIIFPNTVRNVCESAFLRHEQLRSAVVNEGVSKLNGVMEFDQWGDTVK